MPDIFSTRVKPSRQQIRFLPTRDFSRKKLAVIIPALNEARTIGQVIAAIPRVITGINETEIIVISDGSTDGTATEAKKHGANVIEHPTNRGVGAAFQTGIKAALQCGADLIVNIDADGQFNPTDIPQLIAPIQSGHAEFVTTTRFGDPRLIPAMPPLKKWGNYLMAAIVNFITKKNFTDVSCGFRAYSREAALRLTLFGNFTYTQETFIDLAFKNIPMVELPLPVQGERQHGRSRVASNLWRYGLKTATIIFRAARDYQPQYFIGLPGILIFLIGIFGGLFLTWHFITTGQTYPYRSLVTVSGVFIIVGFLMLFISLLADMLHRNRIIIEEAVYLARKNTYDKQNNKQHPS